MFSMVHIAQVILLPLKEDHSQSIQSQSARDIIIQHSSAEVESFEELACLSKLSFLLRHLTDLKVDMGLSHEITLLDTCLCL